MAQLSVTGGNTSPIGALQGSAGADAAGLTGAYTSVGTITTFSLISTKRIQYNFLNETGQSLTSWTLTYPTSVAPLIIAAGAPDDYINAAGTVVNQGGTLSATLFNDGFGVYNYDTGLPWTFDYEADHLTFTAVSGASLPDGDGVGHITSDGTPFALPAFIVLFNPSLNEAGDPATAIAGPSNYSGTELGPVPEPTSGLSLVGGLGLLLGFQRFVRRAKGTVLAG